VLKHVSTVFTHASNWSQHYWHLEAHVCEDVSYEPRPSNNKYLNMLPQYSRMRVIGRNTTDTWKHMCVKTG